MGYRRPQVMGAVADSGGDKGYAGIDKPHGGGATPWRAPRGREQSEDDELLTFGASGTMSQAKPSNRAMGAAVFIEGGAIPLHKDVEQGHGEGQAHGDVAPGAMGGFLTVADLREHREGGLDEHAVIPGAARADLQVGRIALFAPERRISEDDHALGEAGDELVKGTVVGVGGVPASGAQQAPLVENHAEFAADDPAVVGHALAPDAREATAALLPVRMGQLHTIAVSDAEDGRLRQEARGPVLVCRAQAEQARALGQAREQRMVIARQPAIEGPLAASFKHEQQGQGHDLTRKQVRLWVLRDVCHGLIHTVEQIGDKIDGGDGVLLSSGILTPSESRTLYVPVN